MRVAVACNLHTDDDNYYVFYPSWASCIINGFNKVYTKDGFPAVPHPENNANPKKQFFDGERAS